MGGEGSARLRDGDLGDAVAGRSALLTRTSGERIKLDDRQCTEASDESKGGIDSRAPLPVWNEDPWTRWRVATSEEGDEVHVLISGDPEATGKEVPKKPRAPAPDRWASEGCRHIPPDVMQNHLERHRSSEEERRKRCAETRGGDAGQGLRNI